MHSLYKGPWSKCNLPLHAIRLFLAYLTSVLDTIYAPPCDNRLDDGDLQFNSAKVT